MAIRSASSLAISSDTGPALYRVESNHLNRVGMLSDEEIADDCLAVGPVLVSFGPRPAEAIAEIIQDEIGAVIGFGRNRW